MNRLPLLIVVFWAMFCLTATNASAVGTPAGQVINNSATISYTLKGTAFSAISNTSTFVVDDKVLFSLTAADVANVTILSGGSAYMTYILTNSGNATHDFTLSTAVSGTPGFAPSVTPRFYADAAGTIPLPADPNAGGLPYIRNLAPDAAITVYMFISAPATVTDGQTINYVVTAEAYQTANLGIVRPPVKSSTQAAVDAPANKNTNLMTGYVLLADGHGNGGDLDRDGKYAVSARDGSGNAIGFKTKAAAVNIMKSVIITDKFGGNQPTSGATLHYELNVSTTGSGTALDVVITDPIPANTTYTAGTLKLNGTSLTDMADGDAGNVGVSAPGTVTIKLGDMSSATPAQVISFDVKID